MKIGKLSQTNAEQLIQKLRISVLEYRSLPLGSEWHLDLCSSFWRLYVNNRSGAWILHRGKKLPMEAGDFWLVPAWVRFQTGVTGCVTQEYLHFEIRGLPSGFFQWTFDRPLALGAPGLLRSLARQAHGQAPLSRLCWAAVLAQAAFAFALEAGLDRWRGPSLVWTEDRGGMSEVLNALETRFENPPSNEELARLAGCSEDHFIRRFRLATGGTPADYGRGCRLAAAAEWLASTDRTLEDIAAAAGFTDRFHFSRVFKSRFGQAPGAYRRMHRRELAALIGPE
jgi:AraC-like DNA-binding protein